METGADWAHSLHANWGIDFQEKYWEKRAISGMAFAG
jgi:hypothetical protein